MRASLAAKGLAERHIQLTMMKLTPEEEAMRAGEYGAATQWAIDHQIKVGEYLGAADFVPVTQAHVMADTESLGTAGVEWLERLAGEPADRRRLRIPTISDPRGTDFAAAHKLKQQPWMVELERRAIAAFEALGVLMTNTCINYQTIMPPVFGEHVAYGDTGVVIYCNSVCGARSNFEGGPSALSAGITGRTPRYGYHLAERRQASLVVSVTHTPRALDEWGALGGIVGRLAGDYWQVPALVGIDRIPSSDEMKHFGAALASYGSVALFHMVGITPEAPRESDVVRNPDALPRHRIGKAEIASFRASYARGIDTVDLVVFSAPQLSLMEMRQLAGMLDGRRATHSAAGGDEPAGQAGRRSAGPHGAHRGRRRHGPFRHVLLPELCTRNGGGERLATARDEFGEAGQHHRRLRLQAGAAVHAGLRRRRLQRRQDRAMSATIFHARCRNGRQGAGASTCRQGRLLRALRSRPRPRRVLAARAQACRRRAMSDACSCSMRRKAASPPPGCCTR